MPRKAAFHDIVKAALVKDGWKITDDPFLMGFRGTLLFADLGAEKITAVRQRRKKITALRSKYWMNRRASPNLNAPSGSMWSIAV